MKRGIALGLLLLLGAGGCRDKSKAQAAKDAGRALPGDKFVRSGMSGELYNETREERRQVLAAAILLRRLRVYRSKSPAQLLEMMVSCDKCFGWSLDGVDYYLAREGNKLIEAELRSRGAAVRPFLLKCRKDRRSLFTGSSGPPDSIGEMCGRLLARLNR